jgi:cellulose biosynthesis protein BcsQ
VTPSWDQALEFLLAEVEGWPQRVALERVCVIRDLRGQLRLAIKPRNPVDLGTLEARLVERIGGWFASPLLSTQAGSTEARKLAAKVVEQIQGWPNHWPSSWDIGLGRRDLTPDLWCGEQRWHSKDVWLAEGTVELPWKLATTEKDGKRRALDPVVVSFYSFKGGVGRTTTLGIVARRLAHAGKHVAVLDLDLEAPGLSPLFDAETERGMLDLLTEHHATGRVDSESLAAAEYARDEGKGTILVYPVGRLTDSYIAQLASLDFTPRIGKHADTNTVEQSLRAILKIIRKQHPELHYILIDARAGMHDLGGLSLHALSHVDVLVGRGNRATLEGFTQVLHALARRRNKEDLRVVIAQTFLPLDDKASRPEHDRWTTHMFELFETSIYPRIYKEDESLPEVMANDAMHHPWPIPQYDSIARVERLTDIDDSVLDAAPFWELTTRIVELAERSLDEEFEDED